MLSWALADWLQSYELRYSVVIEAIGMLLEEVKSI